jgi:hypothetical protein
VSGERVPSTLRAGAEPTPPPSGCFKNTSAFCRCSSRGTLRFIRTVLPSGARRARSTAYGCRFVPGVCGSPGDNLESPPVETLPLPGPTRRLPSGFRALPRRTAERSINGGFAFACCAAGAGEVPPAVRGTALNPATEALGLGIAYVGATGAVACAINGVLRFSRCGAIAHCDVEYQPKWVRGTTVQPTHGSPMLIESAKTGRLSKPSGHQLT